MKLVMVKLEFLFIMGVSKNREHRGTTDSWDGSMVAICLWFFETPCICIDKSYKIHKKHALD